MRPDKATPHLLKSPDYTYQIKIKYKDIKMKTFNIMCGIGKAKYVVNYHDGIKKHDDGSKFFDIKIFTNKKSAFAFIEELENEGYRWQVH